MSEDKKEEVEEVVVHQSTWEAFKEIFPLLMLMAVVFAGGMMLWDFKYQTGNRMGYWFETCLKTEPTITVESAAQCGRVAHIIHERHKK